MLEEMATDIYVMSNYQESEGINGSKAMVFKCLKKRQMEQCLCEENGLLYEVKLWIFQFLPLWNGK